MNRITWIKRFSGLIAIIFFVANQVPAQNSCPNIDFSSGDFSNWVGRRADFGNWSPDTVFIPGRHDLIRFSGTDPIVDGNLSILPPGKNIGARLGNWIPNVKSQSLSHTLTVSEFNSLILIHYAVVMEHSCNFGVPANQPRFNIRVMDASGEIVESGCSFYEIISSSVIPGFDSLPNGVKWKNWATLPLDLTEFVGEELTIQVLTSDCRTPPSHFGYAYFAAECMPMKIAVKYCEGDTEAILTAPEGFVSYLWEPGGYVGREIVVNDPFPGQEFTCFMQSHVEGCGATLSAVIEEIIIRPDFSASPGNGCKIFFQDQTSIEHDAITSWFWDFGDGNTGTVQNPSHRYAAAGTYQVELAVTSFAGCTNTIIHEVEFLLPLADFDFEIACAGNTITFVDNSVPTPHAGIVTRTWHFGDGNTANGTEVSHFFYEPGIYDVQLIVETSLGCLDSITKPVSIKYLPQPDFSFVNICIGDEVIFTNESTIESNDQLSFRWMMGDGSVYETENVIHRYEDTGTYEVQLIAASVYGCVDTIQKSVTIHPLPLVDFYADPTQGCPPLIVNFHNQSQAGNYTWDFGFASLTSKSNNPAFEYELPGSYNVSLTVESQHGCVNTKTLNDYVTVFPLPAAAFTANRVIAYDSNPEIKFTDASEDAINWFWNFGDDESLNNEASGQPQASHSFKGLGEYTVILLVMNDFGCTDVATERIFILPGKDSFLPNAFNPSGDGLYDYFRPIDPGFDISGFSMLVYDRWGGKVFETNDVSTGWDGTDLRTGRKVQQGVYSYIVYVTMFGISEKYVGSVTVVY